MNQIEFKIGGENRRFNFGLKFLGDVLSHFNTDMGGFGELIDKNPFQTRPAILYFAHCASVQRNQKPVNFTLEDVIEWVDEIDNGISNPNVIQAVELVLESVKRHLPSNTESDGQESKKK
jgi:hypothetical protein